MSRCLRWLAIAAALAAASAAPAADRIPAMARDAASAAGRAPAISPHAALVIGAETLGVVINTADADSVAVGEYYARRRGIPARNVVRVSFAVRTVMAPEEFTRASDELARRMPGGVQALALAWTQPYRVGCMSTTAAFAHGYDPRHCATSCKPTPSSRYFDSDVRLPYSELGMRPAMQLAGSSVRAAKATIDAGIAADPAALRGTAYLMRTDDAARNVRAAGYPATLRLARPGLEIVIRDMNALYDARDVLFYFTGRARVDGLETLRFRPGAIADHLTSNGGMLTDSPQMSSLAWLDAGATASYGTVVEPCAFPQKFPQPAVVMRRYLGGETVIEAYWKSVSMRGQGLFIGEPLARIAPR